MGQLLFCLGRTRMVLLTLLLQFFCQWQQVWSQEAAPKIYTLQDCINQTLEKNPNILVARQDLERSKGVVLQAKAVLYPSLNSDSRLFLENRDVFAQEVNPGVRERRFQEDWFISLQVQQSLYSAGIHRNQIAIAKLGNEIEIIRLQETINNAVFQTVTAFYDVLLNQSEIATRKQNIDLLTKEVARQKDLFEAGRATRFNIVQTEVRLSNEQPGLIQVENNLRVARLNLMEKMGVASNDDPKTQFLIKGDLTFTPFLSDVNSLVTQALSQSPELTRQEKQIEISKRQLQITKASLIPQFDLFVGSRLRENQSRSSFFSSNSEAAFGVMGHWNIFDGFAGKGSGIQAKAEIRKNEIQREATARRIEFDIRKAYLSLKQAEASVLSQKENVKVALESIDLAKSVLETGFGTNLDVLQATVDYATAKNIELQAHHQYHVALAQLEKALFSRIGSLDEKSPLLNKPLMELRASPPMPRNNDPSTK